MDKTYQQVIRELKSKYGIDYTNFFTNYAKKIKNLSKSKKHYKDLNFYLNKKAKKIAQTAKASYVRKQTRNLSDKALRDRFVQLSRFNQAANDLGKKADTRNLKTIYKEIVRRRIAKETNIVKKEALKDYYQDIKFRMKYDKAYTPVSSYTQSGANAMSLEDYAYFKFGHYEDYEKKKEDYKQQAYMMISQDPLQQVIDGYMSDGYMDVNDNIIVYTK